MGAAAPDLRGVAQIGFHAQQAIEKLLKALLTAFGVQPEDQHSLGRLIEQVGRLDRQTADRVGDVSSLTRYAVYHRYPPRVPGGAQPLTRRDVLQDLARARSAVPVLLTAIEARLAASRD
ncbi:HEPN domain-containing protein [Longimicrobium sp.]|uniref:HEPN domain-containing protein n=1 Tax=Longimicrobium sp. TaxID=2029185 RepID=UPI002E2EC0D4|nr:HEPN domain-containing protein [Longimicrobium sp.]HEX6040081.1 HEPN domain-containing protein [Longimicrobium sp.]